MDKLQRMLICTLFILCGLLTRSIGADDVWLEPNAWEIHSPSPNTCPVCDIPDVSKGNDIATMYYKKTIAELFNRSNLKLNTKTGHLERKIILSLTPAQLKIIENSSDIRDFNTAVMAIVKNAKEPDQEQSTARNNESSFWLLKYLWEFLYSMAVYIVKVFSYIYFYSSETRFLIIVWAVMLAMWFIHKRYNKNLILVLIVSSIMFGYFCSYIECNRKLEAEKLVKFITETDTDEPSYLSKAIYFFFKPSKKDQQIEEIKNKAEEKLAFCRPDEVAIIYFNEMFFNQLQVIIKKMVDSMNIIRNTVPFPFNYMGMIALPFLFMAVLPLLFQYFFNPVLWSKIFRDHSPKHHQTEEMFNNNAPQGDRLSGDNLKILFDVLKNKTEVVEKFKNSEVEDVKDFPQAITSASDVKDFPQAITSASDVKDFPQTITSASDDSLGAEETSGDKSVIRINDILEEEESKDGS